MAAFVTAILTFSVVVEMFLCVNGEEKSRLTLDDLFNATEFSLLSYSPTGEHLLIQTTSPNWESNTFQTTSWLYEIQTKKRRLITTHAGGSSKPKWSPSGKWIAFLSTDLTEVNPNNGRIRREDDANTDNFIFLYSLLSARLFPVAIGRVYPSVFAWSEYDSSLYVVGVDLQSSSFDGGDVEWKDVVQYRPSVNKTMTTIFRVDLNESDPSESPNTIDIKTVDFFITELVFAKAVQKLVLTSAPRTAESHDAFEIYVVTLRHPNTVSKLTKNDAYELDLQVADDGIHVTFTDASRIEEDLKHVQPRLYSLNLLDGRIERLAKDFTGAIVGHTIDYNGGVYFLGQLGTEVHIYSQKSPSEKSIRLRGWNGTYDQLTSSRGRNQSIAFTHTSFDKAKEAYFANHVDQLSLAQPITNDNAQLTQRDLPKTEIYRWRNSKDNRLVEGILHYPPQQFRAKNLPLLVLLHGGPFDASLNGFEASWYNWAPLAATHGWLILEPNFVGSTGYGDEFLSDIPSQPVSGPGRDALSAVDELIKEGRVNPRKLAVGGYSYGGFITNWLITETTRFNAALSGSGVIEHVSAWGTSAAPRLYRHFFAGFPWNASSVYQNESPIYRLDRVRTPTLIVTGADDELVRADQSYMLERALHYLGVPSQLLVFPKTGHQLENNPWHGKIKVREELKWLERYGHACWGCKTTPA